VHDLQLPAPKKNGLVIPGGDYIQSMGLGSLFKLFQGLGFMGLMQFIQDLKS
jgi:hypothetical protein